ncbi:MAG: hypothetical protein HN742_41895 [Lentisphaerae bacterium]|nr:hypothetical protein [Lentisphaerota bacterium]MBT4818022.1 hypothetical protein [Lentisphaerota bacterium]MBT5605875.1 hypothetical protein [Lentisphaerota bacterium]MBT7055267.1 hypothetical protein [Lentisphaerota bacterium]MBT7848491.1 hypothetical protein [Lentisphaerota bacterium]
MPITISAPPGPKGFFRLSGTLTLTGPDWRLAEPVSLRTLTENRICGWLVAGPFSGTAEEGLNHVPITPERLDLKKQLSTLAGKKGWEPWTEGNVHGRIDLGAVHGKGLTSPACAVALAVIRLTETVPVRFTFDRSVRLYVDGKRLGTNGTRGNWGSVTLTPGDHVLRVLTAGLPGKAWRFKVASALGGDVGIGAFSVVPPREALTAGTLLEMRAP